MGWQLGFLMLVLISEDLIPFLFYDYNTTHTMDPVHLMYSLCALGCIYKTLQSHWEYSWIKKWTKSLLSLVYVTTVLWCDCLVFGCSCLFYQAGRYQLISICVIIWIICHWWAVTFCMDTTILEHSFIENEIKINYITEAYAVTSSTCSCWTDESRNHIDSVLIKFSFCVSSVF